MRPVLVDEAAELAGVESGECADDDVAAGLDRGQNGRPLGSPRNLAYVLVNDARWDARIRWSSFEDLALLDGRPLVDDDITTVGLWMDEVYGLRVSVDTLLRGVVHVARQNEVHPVGEWLDDLVWDGEQRLDHVLARRFGAEATALNAELGRRWFIGAVARVFQPGCKVDTMLVLVGAQGVGKSTACAALVPRETWFSDTPFDLRSKDAYLQLQGVWLYEVAELQALRRGNAEAVKAFLSSRRDRYRRPYGRLVEDHPRQVVFIGTTNDEEFLEDATGSRRFWPVRTGRVDVGGIRMDRDQLWAEAVVRYREGERWWLDGVGEAALRALSRGHEAGDPWEDAIGRWVERQTEAFTVEQVLAEALGVPIERMDRGRRTRVGVVLARMGCRKSRPRGTATRTRVWTRGEE